MIVYSTSSAALPRVAIYGIGGSADTLPAPRLVATEQSAEYRASAMRRASYVGNAWRWHCALNRQRQPLPEAAPAPLTDLQAAMLDAARWLRRWHAYDAAQVATQPLPAPAPLSAMPLDG